MQRPVFVVIDANLERGQRTSNLLLDKGDAFVTSEVTGILDIHKKQGHIDAIFLDAEATHNLSETVEGVHRVYPAALLYIAGSRIPVSLWGPLAELGVRELVSYPLTPQKIAHLSGFDFVPMQPEKRVERGPIESTLGMPAIAARRQLDRKPTYAKVICVTSPKGGEGRTTLITHLAMNYAKHGPVVIIDADAQGDIANALRLDIAHTITEIEEAKSEKAYLDMLLAVHQDTGIRILASPVGERMNHITRKQLEKAILEYRRFYQVILVDLPQGFLPLHRTALDFATQFISVVTPDPKRYQRVEEYVRKLRAEGGEPGVSPVEFVLNYNKPYSKLEDRPVRALLRDYKVRTVPYDKTLLNRVVGKRFLKASKVLIDVDTRAFSGEKEKSSKHHITLKGWGMKRA